MNYLVDTHILLWSFLETKKLSRNIKKILLDETNIIYYSPISLWEISIKFALKKLFLKGGTPDDFFAEVQKSYYQCKEINAANLVSYYKLPIYHKDPFDRLLIWNAIKSDFTLLSVDENMKMYEKEGLKVEY